MVQLTTELVAELDAEAARRGVSRSALIRDALAVFFQDASDEATARRIVEGYRAVRPATPDEWGDLESLGARSALETSQRLGEEERREGFGPW